MREVVVHLSTASHQLAFLAQAKPELYLQFAAHSSTSTETWDKATLNSLDSVVNIVQKIMHLFLSGVSYVIPKHDFRWRDLRWCGRSQKLLQVL